MGKNFTNPLENPTGLNNSSPTFVRFFKFYLFIQFGILFLFLFYFYKKVDLAGYIIGYLFDRLSNTGLRIMFLEWFNGLKSHNYRGQVQKKRRRSFSWENLFAGLKKKREGGKGQEFNGRNAINYPRGELWEGSERGIKVSQKRGAGPCKGLVLHGASPP